MRIVSRVRILALAVVICSGIFVMVSVGKAQQGTDTPTTQTIESLKKFLRTRYDDKRARYVAAFRDLNGDGTKEAIVYLISNGWCGSGGCSTLILMPNGSS